MLGLLLSPINRCGRHDRFNRRRLPRVLADRMAPKPQGWDVEHRCQTAAYCRVIDPAARPARPHGGMLILRHTVLFDAST